MSSNGGIRLEKEWEAQNRPCRLVIVGGVAGGASAAARARRLDESASITLLEKGPDVSFANCGMPYHIGDTIKDASRLAVHTPGSLGKLLKLSVRTNVAATSIDREKRTLEIKSSTGAQETLLWDRLILSTGAVPFIPPIPGVNHPRVFTLRSLEDMHAIKAVTDPAQDIVVIGAGFIGLEMVEQLREKGKRVTLIEREDQVLPQMDKEMVEPLLSELRLHGVDVHLSDGLQSIEALSDTRVTVHVASGSNIQADVVILGIGVRPDTALAKSAGVELEPSGHVRVNEYQQTSDPAIYAVGDAVMTKDGVLETEKMAAALAGPANRQGRLAADHIFLPNAPEPYPGSLGTAIVKCFDAVAGVTGWNEKRLKRAGKKYRATLVTDHHHAGYYPGAKEVHIKILWDPDTGKLLGGQACGIEGIDKRVDVLATALRAGMTIHDLVHLELSYAPPFGTAKDVLNIAGFVATNQFNGLMTNKDAYDEKDLESGAVQVVDVRERAVVAIKPLKFPGSKNIPLSELRNNVNQLDKAVPIVTVCNVGKTSYFAARVLDQLGYNVTSLQGGVSMHPELLAKLEAPKPIEVSHNTVTITQNIAPSSHSVPASLTLDCTGLACPGPLMRLTDLLPKLAPGQGLTVTASDPGFANDCQSFARVSGLEVVSLKRDKSLITVVLRKPGGEGPSASTSAPSVEAGPSSSNAASAAFRGGASIICFSCEMDKVLAALVLANGACAMTKATNPDAKGPSVTLFFTFWGLNVLKKAGVNSLWHNIAAKDKPLMDRIFSMLLGAGHNHLPLSHLNFGGLGAPMMQMQMDSKHLPTIDGLLQSAQQCGVRLLACTMSMEAMGVKKEELIDGVELGGVADFLASARETDLKLFI